VAIEIPPLRARVEDIPLLAQHFLARRAHPSDPSDGTVADGERRSRVLGPGVVEALMAHDWPGNVRELENLIERLWVLTRGEVVTLRNLADVGFGPSVVHGSGAARGIAQHPRARTGEQMMIEDALRKHQGDKAKAARFIGWNRQKLYRRMRSYAIPKDFGKAA
jgi:DNA-binding NtrC family response regulator